MPKLFESEKDLEGYLFRITDNGGRTFDRFTIAFCDGDYFGSSIHPNHPQGFGQWGELINVQILAEGVEEGLERDLRWIDLPEQVRHTVIGSLNDGFSDYLQTAEAKVPSDRDAASPNEGGPDSVGRGIYRAADGFRIRGEDRPADEDLGPYPTFREAVLATLPTSYDLSGPEYHPEIKIWEAGEPTPLWDCRDNDEAES